MVTEVYRTGSGVAGGVVVELEVMPEEIEKGSRQRGRRSPPQNRQRLDRGLAVDPSAAGELAIREVSYTV